MIAGILLYVAIYFVGKWQNETIAKKWSVPDHLHPVRSSRSLNLVTRRFGKHKPIFAAQFSVPAHGDELKQGEQCQGVSLDAH